MPRSRINFNFNFPTAEELGINFNDVSVAELADALAKSGVKKGGRFSKWIESRFRQLKEFHIETHLKRLGESGLCRETLGISMFLIQLAPAFDHVFKDMLGDKQVRIRNAKSLTAAAAVLESMSKLMPEMSDMVLGLPNPASTAKAVRHYSMMLVWGEAIYTFIGAKSVAEVMKFSLAGLVKGKTGKFHDREVSALVGAALYNFDYDETAHRVWRIRSFERLEKSFSLGPKLLCALNDVLSCD